MGGRGIAQDRDVGAVGDKYHLAYEAAPIAMVVTTQDGLVVDGNPTFLAWSGYTRAEIIGKQITDLYVDPAVRAELLACFRSRGRIGPVDLQFRRKSGEIVIGRIHTETLRGPRGTSMLFTAVEDVTRFVELRDRLSAKLTEYRQLFEQSRDAIFVTAVDGTIVDANPAARRMFDVSDANGLPASAAQIYANPAERAALLAELERAGYVSAEDVEFRTAAGRTFTGEVTAVVRRDVDGKVLGVQGTIRDVTERRRTQQLLRTLIDASPMAIIGTDAAGTVTLWNRAAETLFGWREDEIVGTPAARVVPDDLLVEYADMRAATVAGNPPRMFETWRLRKGGERFRALVSLGALPANGMAGGIVAVAEDVTERRRVEAQLRQSQKFEALGRLAGGVAHDFNNLLTVVMAEAATIREAAPDGSEQRTSAKEIEEAARRGAALTKQLLAVSRQQVLSPAVVDLAMIVGESERMLRRLIAENVEIRIEMAPDLWLVRADPSQLHQILLNLAINARDAMPDGGTLTIAARNRTLSATRWCVDGVVDPGEYVQLSVADTGTGMDEATVASVFEPFFTTKAGSGTGLGLSTVLGVVKQSRGGIEIHSRPGLGTEFVVFLPRSIEAATAPPAQPRGAPAAVDHTVLLVEDEAAVREVTRRLLEGAGYRVLAASDGDVALELAETVDAPIDVLVTDAVMPHVGGALLATTLLARRPRLGVVFVSGYADAETLAHARTERWEFVEKPFSGETLIAAIRRAVARASAR